VFCDEKSKKFANHPVNLTWPSSSNARGGSQFETNSTFQNLLNMSAPASNKAPKGQKRSRDNDDDEPQQASSAGTGSAQGADSDDDDEDYVVSGTRSDSDASESDDDDDE